MGDDRPEVQARLGTQLKGKWTLERIIGVGGMAAVYAARHQLGSEVAIKVLHPEIARSKELRERFEREARVMATLDHPGAVDVHDVDHDAEGIPFIVMELLSGESIKERAKRLGQLPISEVLRYADDCLEVLETTHAAGVIHRDIKPDNLFLTADDRVKVLDFGIARINEGAPLTVVGTRLGTLAYMPPEQVRGQAVDATADIFAVGAVMFRLIARRRVHDAKTESELLVLQSSKPAPKLSSVCDAPPEVCAIVDRALAYDRNKRYPDAASMRADIRPLRASEELDLVATPSGSAPVVVAREQTAATSVPGAGASERDVTAATSVGGGQTAATSVGREQTAATSVGAMGETAAAIPFAVQTGPDAGSPYSATAAAPSGPAAVSQGAPPPTAAAHGHAATFTSPAAQPAHGPVAATLVSAGAPAAPASPPHSPTQVMVSPAATPTMATHGAPTTAPRKSRGPLVPILAVAGVLALAGAVYGMVTTGDEQPAARTSDDDDDRRRDDDDDGDREEVDGKSSARSADDDDRGDDDEDAEKPDDGDATADDEGASGKDGDAADGDDGAGKPPSKGWSEKTLAPPEPGRGDFGGDDPPGPPTSGPPKSVPPTSVPPPPKPKPKGRGDFLELLPDG